MIHPCTEVRFINNEKGFGLFATKFIPCGTITWAFDDLDREITPAKLKAFDEFHREIILKYSFRNNKGNYIFCWDNTRYTNHSFRANCCMTPYNFEIAARDIHAGEEVTNDYGYFNIIEPFEADNEGGDRSVVYPDDLGRFSDRWDEQIQTVFPKIVDLEQPLRDILSSRTWEMIQAISDGRKRLESIKTCYYDSKEGDR